MAGVYKDLTIVLSGKTTQLEAALRKCETKAKNLDKEMKQVKKSIELDPSSPQAYARQMELLSQSIENTKKKLEALKDAENRHGKEKMSTDQWTKLQHDIVQAEGELKSYNKQMQQLVREHASANSALGRTADKLDALGEKAKSVGDTMQKVGMGLTIGVTAPIVGAATASVKAATDIDTALTGVRKTVDGSAEDYERLKDAAVEYSKTTSTSAAEMLDVMALGAQLGYGIDELEDFAKTVSGLDIATNMDADTAATQLAQFFNVMGTAHDETSNFASAIIALGNNMSTTEADIMNMSQRISGAGKSIGLSEADVLGLAAALSSVGIEAEAGGSAISTILSNIDKDVALDTENLRKWAEVAGMSAEEFAEAWNDDALGTFMDVMKGMQDSSENTAVLLDELGVSSLRQTDAMKRLANASELLPNAVELANTAYRDNTALAAEVANFNESLAVKFDMVRNRVTAVAAEIGAPLADAMLEAIDAAEPLFEAIENGARAFSEMSDEEQGAIIQTVAIIAALGPALTLFGKVTSNVDVLGKAMHKLSGIVSDIAITFGKVPSGIDKTSASMAQAANKAKLASVGMNALKGAAVGLAIAGIAVLASAIADYLKKAEAYHKATDGMVDKAKSLASASDVLSSGMGKQVTAAGKAASAWKDYKKAAEEAAERGKELAESMDSAFSNAAVDASMAQAYADKIAELAGNIGDSPEKLYELKDAIEKYNELTGNSIEITDEANGAISISTEELQKNTEAFKQNAYAKAASEMAAESMKREVELEMELSAATKQLEDDTAAYKQALEDLSAAKTPWDVEAANGTLQELTGKLAQDQQAVESLTAQQQAQAETTQLLNDKMAEYSQAAEDARNKTEELDDEKIEDKEADVDVHTDEAEENVRNLQSLMSQIVSKTVTIGVNAAALEAAGGFYKLHANGGFVTNGPTYLGRDRLGYGHIAGEAGREWIKTHADGTTSIVPIENRRYLKPYAQEIASMIGGGSSTVYNISIDGARINDDPAIRDAFITFMSEVNRKKAMNVG